MSHYLYHHRSNDFIRAYLMLEMSEFCYWLWKGADDIDEHAIWTREDGQFPTCVVVWWCPLLPWCAGTMACWIAYQTIVPLYYCNFSSIEVAEYPEAQWCFCCAKLIRISLPVITFQDCKLLWVAKLSNEAVLWKLMSLHMAQLRIPFSVSI